MYLEYATCPSFEKIKFRRIIGINELTNNKYSIYNK